ncbi:MAG: ABC transporter permease [Bacillota bacterium]|uniref:Glutathione transport system permease protein GsiD n=1 Tax=Virgibacillus salarius TaxID=447199 RepID=A0A941DX22_9BACI|nr:MULTISPECIES: ABC transporter permease subunit [Bacillaceae]NAZ07771.1 ABC transporter permease subunit [Agaribacter marinus]MBR7795053.1 ABC transporter permease subunit [Virgibacillus salarius]MCC2248442.1 ABC transporter permease subunit [Virgibacillus sp. AGTR]MDY7043123.1 ABC transporter permease subunit [Virgibacillus sp. M23]QRZ16692.1 ABC transporter permease subunit [Virgibacillus sp. AGTR]
MIQTEAITQEQLDKQRQGRLYSFWKEFRKKKPALFSLFFIGFLVIVMIIGPYVVPYDPAAPDYNKLLESPSLQHLFGTDAFGRDILSRLAVGARISLTVSISAVLLGAIVGTVLGLISGYFGKWMDRLIMRICDVLFAFPDLILAIGIVAILGPGLKNVVIAVSFFSIPSFARIVRSATLESKEMLFVEATRSIGASNRRIIWKHIFPETIPTIIVYFTMKVGTAILAAASLSFLGLGAEPSSPDWGAMLSKSRDYIDSAFHLVFFPGLIIFLTVLAFNVLGDGLRDVLDPKTKD